MKTPPDCIYFKKDLRCHQTDLQLYSSFEGKEACCHLWNFPNDPCIYKEKYPEEKSTQPYLDKISVRHVSNPNYGDDRKCVCGALYINHFDSYGNRRDTHDGNRLCFEFQEKK